MTSLVPIGYLDRIRDRACKQRVIVTPALYFIYKTRNYVDKSTLQNLHFIFVYPCLIYCVEVWGNSCSTHLEPLIVKEKLCVRTKSFSHFLAHTEPIFQNLNILCFPKLAIHRVSLLMFKNCINILQKADLFFVYKK